MPGEPRYYQWFKPEEGRNERERMSTFEWWPDDEGSGNLFAYYRPSPGGTWGPPEHVATCDLDAARKTAAESGHEYEEAIR